MNVKDTPEITLKLVLLRHGKTLANEQHLYCGATDIALSESGVTELRLAKEAGVYQDLAPSIFITSGMQRADQTLTLLFGKEPDKRLPCFVEMHFGEFEMKSYDELKEQADYQRWISDIHHVSCPNGESEIEFHSRLEEGMDELLSLYRSSSNDTKTVLLVAHGGVIAWAMERFFKGVKNFYEWQPRNGGGYLLTFYSNSIDYIAI